jgi:hypothetical protein
MLEADKSQSLVDSAVSEVKGSTTLSPDNQKDTYSGHDSAPYNSQAKKGDYGHDED